MAVEWVKRKVMQHQDAATATSSHHKKSAARPTAIAPALTKRGEVPPVNGDGDEVGPVTVPVPVGRVVEFPLVNVKLAQVSLVVLLV